MDPDENHRGPHLSNICVLNFLHMHINREVNWIIYVKLNTYAEAHLCHFLLSKDVKMNINELCRGVLQRCRYVGRCLIFKVCGVKVFVSIKCKHVQKTWQNQSRCLSRCIYSIKPHWFTQNKAIIWVTFRAEKALGIWNGNEVPSIIKRKIVLYQFPINFNCITPHP